MDRSNVPQVIYGPRDVASRRKLYTILNGVPSTTPMSDVGLTRLVIGKDEFTKDSLLGAQWKYILPNNLEPLMNFKAEAAGRAQTVIQAPVCMCPAFSLKVDSLGEKLVRGMYNSFNRIVSRLLEVAVPEIDGDSFYLTFNDEEVARIQAEEEAVLPQILVYSKIKGDVLPLLIGLDPNGTFLECAEKPSVYGMNGSLQLGGYRGLDMFVSLGDYTAEGEKVAKDEMTEATLVFIDRWLLAMLIEGPENAVAYDQNSRGEATALKGVSFKYDMLSTLMRMIPGSLDAMPDKFFRMIDFATPSRALHNLTDKIAQVIGIEPSNMGLRSAEAAVFICRYIAFSMMYRMFHELSYFKDFASPMHAVTLEVYAPLKYQGLMTKAEISARFAGHQISGVSTLTETSNEPSAESALGEGSVPATFLNVDPAGTSQTNKFGFCWISIQRPDTWPGLHTKVFKDAVSWKQLSQSSHVARTMYLRRGAIQVEQAIMFSNLHPEDVASDYEVGGQWVSGKIEYKPRSYLDNQAPTTTFYQPFQMPFPKLALSYGGIFAAIVLGRHSCLSGKQGVVLAGARTSWAGSVDARYRENVDDKRIPVSLAEIWDWCEPMPKPIVLGDYVNKERSIVHLSNWFTPDQLMADEIGQRVNSEVNRARKEIIRKANAMVDQERRRLAALYAKYAAAYEDVPRPLMQEIGENSVISKYLR